MLAGSVSRERVRELGAVRLFGRFEGGGRFDVLATALDPAPVALDLPLDEGDVAQILYTSGTTALPKGAVLTHRAILAQYQSCIYDLEFRGDDKALAALPLYHTAQMHAFTVPQLMVGAFTLLIEAP